MLQVLLGYNHPEILKNKDLLGEVSINKTTLSDIYNVLIMQIF